MIQWWCRIPTKAHLLVCNSSTSKLNKIRKVNNQPSKLQLHLMVSNLRAHNLLPQSLKLLLSKVIRNLVVLGEKTIITIIQQLLKSNLLFPTIAVHSNSNTNNSSGLNILLNILPSNNQTDRNSFNNNRESAPSPQLHVKKRKRSNQCSKIWTL